MSHCKRNTCIQQLFCLCDGEIIIFKHARDGSQKQQYEDESDYRPPKSKTLIFVLEQNFMLRKNMHCRKHTGNSEGPGSSVTVSKDQIMSRAVLCGGAE